MKNQMFALCVASCLLFLACETQGFPNEPQQTNNNDNTNIVADETELVINNQSSVAISNIKYCNRERRIIAGLFGCRIYKLITVEFSIYP